MTDHFKFLNEAVQIPPVISTENLVRYRNVFCVKQVDKHKAQKSKYRRVYVKCSVSGTLSTVGWVALCDIASCMICSTEFNVGTAKRHCYACGNIVCSNCSTSTALLNIPTHTDSVVVCDICCWGQARTSANFV